ncbi:MAG: DNA repair protein RecO [Deltaproteobacteria bacterium]|nr:MAG: DNA repair protein RecO [Deltaproteobacteria bacterium]
MTWTEALVVGAVDLGESDRIMRLLTAERGRISAVARRVRSSGKRWAGVLDVGNHVRLRFGRSRGSLASISEAEAVAAPRRARSDLERVALLAYGCELCAGLAPEDHEASKLWRLLHTWIALLEGPKTPRSASRAALEAKALTFAGLAPRLVHCARCGDLARDPLVFDPDSGGVVHQHCGAGRSILAEHAAVLEGLRRTPLADTVELELPAEVRNALPDFAEYHLGRGLKSRGLVAELGL